MLNCWKKNASVTSFMEICCGKASGPKPQQALRYKEHTLDAVMGSAKISYSSGKDTLFSGGGQSVANNLFWPAVLQKRRVASVLDHQLPNTGQHQDLGIFVCQSWADLKSLHFVTFMCTGTLIVCNSRKATYIFIFSLTNQLNQYNDWSVISHCSFWYLCERSFS